MPTDQKEWGVSFAGRMLLPQIANTNFLFVGAIGSGKTTSILLLMQSVLPLIGQGLNRRALIYDAKTEFIPYLDSMVPGKWFTFNPFDNRCVAWDMARDINDPASALELAEILINTNRQRNKSLLSKSGASHRLRRDSRLYPARPGEVEVLGFGLHPEKP